MPNELLLPLPCHLFPVPRASHGPSAAREKPAAMHDAHVALRAACEPDRRSTYTADTADPVIEATTAMARGPGGLYLQTGTQDGRQRTAKATETSSPAEIFPSGDRPDNSTDSETGRQTVPLPILFHDRAARSPSWGASGYLSLAAARGSTPCIAARHNRRRENVAIVTPHLSTRAAGRQG